MLTEIKFLEPEHLHIDPKLTALLSQGDRKAFGEIYHRYWAELFNSAYKRLKNREQCIDVVQDVFADLWKRRETVIIENYGAYLHAAVRYQVFRLAARKRIIPAFYELYDTIATSPFHADNDLNRKELEELTEVWLNSLPRKRKEIFLLQFRENLSTKEIADHLNISQKTVQNQLGLACRDFSHKIKTYSLFLSFLTTLVS